MAIARRVSRDALGALLAATLSVACRAPNHADTAGSAPPANPATRPSSAPRGKAAMDPALPPAAASLPVVDGTGVPVSAASAAGATVPRRRYVVAAVGDSLTDFRAHGGGYLKLLQERCPESRFDNFGKGGDMVNQMRRRLEKDVLVGPTTPYTHLIVFGGVNDLYSDLTAGRTVAKIARDLSTMYADAHQRGVEVIALTVAPWGGFGRYFTEARGATTLELDRFILDQKKTGAADFVVDTYPLLSCGEPEKLCDAFTAPFHDGLHFGPAAHRKIADALFDAVFSDCR